MRLFLIILFTTFLFFATTLAGRAAVYVALVIDSSPCALSCSVTNDTSTEYAEVVQAIMIETRGGVVRGVELEDIDNGILYPPSGEIQKAGFWFFGSLLPVMLLPGHIAHYRVHLLGAAPGVRLALTNLTLAYSPHIPPVVGLPLRP